MNLTEIKTKTKQFWNWVWHSDSILSWLVALIFIFIFVKFIFFPTLSLIMGTSLPLAGVESSSMDHKIVENDYGILTLCDKTYLKKDKIIINFDEYWKNCGKWYEEREISKDEFLKFPIKNGFSKGDIIIVWGRFQPKLGDIIIFKPNKESEAPRPIIHRIIKIENGTIQTKGDHNPEQLKSSNNNYRTDETSIKEEQIVGKAIFKIPYLGWFKIIVSDILKKIFSLL
ncbi:S26 family signal peptidase [Candidatus Pacearchaeota archaeon]|nr:S26 family signal peptidase [Candidatus Pacearchaeota archaeon]